MFDNGTVRSCTAVTMVEDISVIALLRSQKSKDNQYGAEICCGG